MSLRFALLCLPLLGLAACVAEPAARSADDYAFVGTWDCGVATFVFTNTTYNNGSETLKILGVRRDASNYTLTFAGNYTIGLAAVTAQGMTWVSGRTGDQFNCLRKG